MAKLTFGERASDFIARVGKSWTFILGLNFGMAFYMLLQHELSGHAFDPYPYILLNLFLSWMAANQAPVIMMSQGRQDEALRLIIQQMHTMLQQHTAMLEKQAEMLDHESAVIEALRAMIHELEASIILMVENDEEISEQLEDVMEELNKDAKDDS